MQHTITPDQAAAARSMLRETSQSARAIGRQLGLTADFVRALGQTTSPAFAREDWNGITPPGKVGRCLRCQLIGATET